MLEKPHKASFSQCTQSSFCKSKPKSDWLGRFTCWKQARPRTEKPGSCPVSLTKRASKDVSPPPHQRMPIWHLLPICRPFRKKKPVMLYEKICPTSSKTLTRLERSDTKAYKNCRAFLHNLLKKLSFRCPINSAQFLSHLGLICIEIK